MAVEVRRSTLGLEPHLTSLQNPATCEERRKLILLAQPYQGQSDGEAVKPSCFSDITASPLVWHDLNLSFVLKYIILLSYHSDCATHSQPIDSLNNHALCPVRKPLLKRSSLERRLVA